MPPRHIQNKTASTGTDRTRPHCIVRAMITSQGYGLIAELIATAFLIAALTGFFVQRSKPWAVGVTMAFMILIVAATVLIASST
jgi:glycerol uptake facilitator-like aquaporin